ncbi:MAG TPA: 3-methyladenine DNA glycosylase [Mycobacteriales bacterium]|nr:3-methyladenine DNA glycosylase [Mycobacteriales bacterium]
MDAWTAPVLERARRGEKHPVEDFLFTYYAHRPGQLRRWSPGAGVVLAGAPAPPPWTTAPGGAVLGPPPERVLRAAARTADLLAATASRPPHLGCFGLHEWAMVHGSGVVRHAAWPLRLGAAGTTAVVEELPVRCSHADAFRFFTASARPLNALQPTRDTQVELEQPGCLHATMDLYRAAFTLSPWVPAELVADCFELARRVRVLDMRASPYDFTGLGLTPVAVETPAGRAEYAAAQRAFAAEAAPLRERVLTAARALL